MNFQGPGVIVERFPFLGWVLAELGIDRSDDVERTGFADAATRLSVKLERLLEVLERILLIIQRMVIKPAKGFEDERFLLTVLCRTNDLQLLIVVFDSFLILAQ